MYPFVFGAKMFPHTSSVFTSGAGWRPLALFKSHIPHKYYCTKKHSVSVLSVVKVC